MQGHCKHELWGLAVHPHKNEYCTVGDDQTVRIWDVDTHSLLRLSKLDTMARACTYSPDGTQVRREITACMRECLNVDVHLKVYVRICVYVRACMWMHMCMCA